MSFRINGKTDLKGLRITVMGLGLNGGGLPCARFCVDAGAIVTVTDMKGEKELAASIASLEGLPVRYVLGRHDMADFETADIVIKNPAVKPDSPYLKAAKQVETDLSLFLRCVRPRIVAVTGSKGKSSTSSAIAFSLKESGYDCRLGGNITVSPLSFIDEITEHSIVVLELSSWQLADLRGMKLLDPEVAVITAIMPDHMNRYSSMEEYVDDKREIYRSQSEAGFTVCSHDDEWGRSFFHETPATAIWYSADLPPELAGATLEGDEGFLVGGKYREKILSSETLLPGRHQKVNMLAAATTLKLMGMENEAITATLARFPGVEHRLELFHEAKGVRFYNDSAATIPQAVKVAVEAMDRPTILITGGTDKNIDFEPLEGALGKLKRVVLLKGTGTDKMLPYLEKDGVAYEGPFDTLDRALEVALSHASSGDAVLLSPGCTSFGMFVHEFDRGAKFKELVKAKTK